MKTTRRVHGMAIRWRLIIRFRQVCMALLFSCDNGSSLYTHRIPKWTLYQNSKMTLFFCQYYTYLTE